MKGCREFVRLKYFDPCECGSHKRHFCMRLKDVYCHQCHPDREPHSIKVFRNMHNDVVRVPVENYGDVRTFRCNGRYVINIRPPGKPSTTSLYDTFCTCGRGIVKESKYCSIQCLVKILDVAPKSPAKTTVYKPCRMMYIRRRKSVPYRSCVL